MLGRMRAADRILAALRSGVSVPDILVEYLGISPLGEDGEVLPSPTLGAILQSFIFQSFQSPRPIRSSVTDIAEVVSLFERSTNIVCIIGAGASIGPDFRSPGGLYDTISTAGALDDPYQVFDLDYFARDPTVFWRFAHMTFPAVNPDHSQAHFFLSRLASRGKLLRLYTQNVDALETGIPPEKLRCVHGSWRESACVACGRVHGIEDLRPDVERQAVPVCAQCGGAIKPGIVFFGQRTNIEDADIDFDSEHADLLVVIGTSMRVAPVSYLPQVISAPAILINREPVTCEFSAELLGDCDEVCCAIEKELGWREDGRAMAEFKFVQPNKFLLQSEGTVGTKFVETGRNMFLVTPKLAGEAENFE